MKNITIYKFNVAQKILFIYLDIIIHITYDLIKSIKVNIIINIIIDIIYQLNLIKTDSTTIKPEMKSLEHFQ